MHVLLDLLDGWQRPVTAELTIRSDTVELRVRGPHGGYRPSRSDEPLAA